MDKEKPRVIAELNHGISYKVSDNFYGADLINFKSPTSHAIIYGGGRNLNVSDLFEDDETVPKAWVLYEPDFPNMLPDYPLQNSGRLRFVVWGQHFIVPGGLLEKRFLEINKNIKLASDEDRIDRIIDQYNSLRRKF